MYSRKFLFGFICTVISSCGLVVTKDKEAATGAEMRISCKLSKWQKSENSTWKVLSIVPQVFMNPEGYSHSGNREVHTEILNEPFKVRISADDSWSDGQFESTITDQRDFSMQSVVKTSLSSQTFSNELNTQDLRATLLCEKINIRQ